MKRPILTGIATLAVALGVFAQGIIFLDNSGATTVNQGLCDLTAGNFYAGTYGLQLFELSPPPTGPALASLLNGINGAGNGVAGYDVMVADGFALENTWLNQTTTMYYITLGAVTMPDVTPAGGNVILGLAVWNTSTSFATMLATPGAHLGVIAFPQATISAGLANPGTPSDICAGWLSLNGGTGQPLVMTTVPEPGTLALAGLAVAALLARAVIWRSFFVDRAVCSIKMSGQTWFEN
jgi:hypothetical protein